MTLFLATLFLFGLAVPGMAITVEMVTVGDPGNGADTNGLGDVAYEYRIGKYEVTVAQYTEFLNSVAATDSNSLYNTRMATNNNVSGIGRSGSSGSYTYNVITRLSAPTNSANFPIAFVSWFDAARFVNWLANGATNGASTETGTYTLANWTNGNAVARNATNPNTGLPPTFWLPTEDEWHKAAFYKGGGTNAGYWGYPTQSDAVPTNNIDFPGETNQANYRPAPDNRFTVNQSATYSPNVHYLTTVGFFSNSPGPYGNFDMGGNLNEWTDGTNTLRWARGGSWSNTVVPLQSSCSLQLFFADTESSIIGFRVAGVAATGDNANLAALVLGGETLTPAFAADTTNYAVHVAQTVTNITLRPTVAAPGATLAVNGTNLVSGSTRSIGLSLGANIITTVVTAPDGFTTRSYAVTVYRLTDKPTLNSLPNLTIAEDSSEQSVALAGIAAGDGPGQPRALKLIATSSNTNVVPHPTITYSSPDSTGTLAFTPRPERSGNATITVTVEDGGPDGDTNTATGNETFSRTFTVTVTPVNDLPTFNALPDLTVAQDSGAQTVPLAGINAGPQETQPLRVTASSSQPGLIPNPVVTYTSPQAAGSLRFTPQAGVAGSAVVTVRVEDGGPDSNLNTVGDNQVFTRTFTVTVTASTSNANLAGLVPNVGTLNPTFAVTNTNYSLDVSNPVSFLRLTPTLADESATVSVDGTNVTSGSASSPLALGVGTNLIPVTVTAQNGSTTRAYSIRAVRAPLGLVLTNTNPLVTAAGYVAGGPLSVSLRTNPSPGQVIKVVDNTSSDPVAGTFDGLAEGGEITATNGGNTFRFAISYVGGDGNDITLTRIAGPGQTGADFRPILTLGPATQSGLTLRLTGTVNPNGFLTTARFLYGTNSNSLNLTSNVAFTSTNGTNALTVTSTISSGLTLGRTYYYRLTASNVDGVANTEVGSILMRNTNANLSALQAIGGTLAPTFTATTTNYTVNLSNAVSLFSLRPTLADSNATVAVNGAAVTSGNSSIPTTLNVGTNFFTNVVTAQDGVTTRSYRVAVVRAPMNLSLSNGAAGLTASNGYVASGPLNLTLGFAPTPGQVITLVNNTSGNATTGIFNGLLEGATVTATNGGNTFRFAISYAGGDGNDITLTRTAGPGQVNHFVTTFAGSSEGNTDGTGAGAQFAYPHGAAVDAAGNVYVADFSNSRIRKVTAAGVVTTLAGSDPGYADGTGTSAKFYNPRGVAVDAVGNVYVADSQNNRIRKVTASGVVTTLAGSSSGYTNGTGTNAKFSNPRGVAVDAVGNVYVADFLNSRIRKVTAAGVVTTLAGSGVAGYADGNGTNAQFSYPYGLAVDAVGNVYVADYGNNLIRKVDANGEVTTLAGSGVPGYADGTGANAQFYEPMGMAVDAVGNVYVADSQNNRIRKVTAAGVVTTLAGSDLGYADGTGTNAQFASPRDVAVDAVGNVYVGDSYNHRIRKIASGYLPILTLGPATQSGLTLRLTGTVNPNGFLTTARFLYGTNSNSLSLTSPVTLNTSNGTSALAVTSTISSGLTLGRTYYYRLTASNVDGVANTEVGSILLRNTNTSLSNLVAVGGALTPGFAPATTNYTVIVSNTVSFFSLRPTLADSNATVTVNGSPVTSGDNSVPAALALGTNVFTNVVTAQDGSTTRTYRVTVVRGGLPTLTNTTNALVTANGYAAGGTLNLTLGFAPTPGQVINLVNNLTNPVVGTFTGLTNGATVTATNGGNTFRFAISYTGGDGNDITLTRDGGRAVFTLAGGGGPDLLGSGCIDGTGTNAAFWRPNGLAVDGSGNVYVADTFNHRIRKVTPAGEVTTVAGAGTGGGFANGIGTNAAFYSPYGLALDASGNLYVADTSNHLIRQIRLADGNVTTLAGSGTDGFLDGAGSTARFWNPQGLAVDGQDSVYVTDANNQRIRVINLANSNVSTLAGSGVPGGTDGTGTNALFSGPFAATHDLSGNLYIAEPANQKIRKIRLADTNVTTLGIVEGDPYGIAVDVSGNIFVADQGFHRIRKVNSSGQSTILAGSSADLPLDGYVDGPATQALFFQPAGLAVDGNGTIYVADNGNHVIRKITEGFRPVLTLGATTRSATNLVLTGTVNPNGFVTTARFLYGTNRTNLNLTSNVTLTPNNGTNALAVTSTITLSSITNSPRFFRLTASNIDGVASSAVTPLTIVSVARDGLGNTFLQVTGAAPGSTGGGNATGSTRTLYFFASDSSASPSYAGTAWPHVKVLGQLVAGPGVTATLSTSAAGGLLVNGRPVYQYINDTGATTAAGVGTFWPGIQASGASTTTAASGALNP